MDEREIIACIDAVRLSVKDIDGDYGKGIRTGLALLQGRVERQFRINRALGQSEPECDCLEAHEPHCRAVL